MKNGWTTNISQFVSVGFPSVLDKYFYVNFVRKLANCTRVMNVPAVYNEIWCQLPLNNCIVTFGYRIVAMHSIQFNLVQTLAKSMQPIISWSHFTNNAFNIHPQRWSVMGSLVQTRQGKQFGQPSHNWRLLSSGRGSREGGVSGDRN